jgi:hypothetical protein
MPPVIDNTLTVPQENEILHPALQRRLDNIKKNEATLAELGFTAVRKDIKPKPSKIRATKTKDPVSDDEESDAHVIDSGVDDRFNYRDLTVAEQQTIETFVIAKTGYRFIDRCVLNVFIRYFIMNKNFLLVFCRSDPEDIITGKVIAVMKETSRNAYVFHYRDEVTSELEYIEVEDLMRNAKWEAGDYYYHNSNQL